MSAPSVTGSFTITIGDKKVAKPGDSDEERVHAKTGSDAAVFKLDEHQRLESGDWYLGRGVIEDLSLRPKQVYWFKKHKIGSEQVQHSQAQETGEGQYRLLVGGSPLIEKEGLLYAELLNQDGDGKKATIEIQK